MTFSFNWGNDSKTVLVGTCEGRWKWSDLLGALQAAEALLTSVYHPVTLIVDCKNSDWLPAGVTTHFQRFASFLDHPAISTVILVRVSPLIGIYTKLFLQNYAWFSYRFHLADDWNEVYTCLNGQPCSPELSRPAGHRPFISHDWLNHDSRRA